MFIECENCQVRPAACDDCVVTALLGVSVSQGVDVGEPELRALDVLADVGMVAPLRLSRPDPSDLPNLPDLSDVSDRPEGPDRPTRDRRRRRAS